MKSKEEKKQKKQAKKLKKIQKKETIKRLPVHRKVPRYIAMAFVCICTIIFVLASVGTVAHATGLVDDTINTANEYSKYGLDNYQLDFYVDNSWGWLPWNWSDGLGKSVMYGLYAITNFIWTISLYLSNATGYLVQEAYRLDFISQTADSIGKNIQTIAGVNQHGFSSSGFYVGFLLIFILILGIYVAYTGLIKRETTKAVQAVLNFVIVFILSASFIAYAPDYVGKINDFSKDVSSASLDIGTRIVMPNSNTQGKNSVDMIRDSLFSVQVKQPWLLLQYGSTDVDETRVEQLLSISPDTNNGEDREKIVIDEIENQDNANLSISKVISRLGTVFFLFLFNIGISIFVFLLTGIMIFSQVLFIIFAMFLPVSFLLSMIPSFDGMAKRAITKLFNVIMTRAGITLVITVAFSISTMLYSLAGSSPFFMIMFLQIVTFAGIYFKLGDIMNLFALQSNDSQQMGRQLFRRPRRFVNHHSRRFQQKMSRAIGGSSRSSTVKSEQKESTPKSNKANHERNNQTATRIHASNNPTKQPDSSMKNRSMGEKAGEAVGNVMDTKNRMADKAVNAKDNVKDAPANVKYALHKGKRDLVRNANDFSSTIRETKDQKQQEREQNRQRRQTNLAQKRLEMDRAKQQREAVEPMASMAKYKRDYEERKRPVPTKTPTTSTAHDRGIVPAKEHSTSTAIKPTVQHEAPKKSLTPPAPSQSRQATIPKNPTKQTTKEQNPSSQTRTTTIRSSSVKKSQMKERKPKK
ncbi:CD3337/EF1877 family mobilome membrane protein [Enterococcus faecalis]|uniref:CD3337/EF1877 family mobilome membrane protein n=1 Tax=Enterococcus faecalis TaxID=1351 RepID=UPI0038601717